MNFRTSLLALILVNGLVVISACPTGPADGDAGPEPEPSGGDGSIVVDGTETPYTLVANDSKLLIIVEKAVSIGCPSFFHSHVVEADAFGLSFAIDEGDAAASSMTVTVPSARLNPDDPANRALFELTADEEVPESFRDDIKVSVLGELDAAEFPTLKFEVDGISGFEAGDGTSTPNTADVTVTFGGGTSTIEMAFAYETDGDRRIIRGTGVLDGTPHGMPRETECYKHAELPLHLTLVLEPGEDATVVDAGNVVPFTPTEYPYEGDCVDKIAWNDVRDVIVLRCAGCHSTDPDNGASIPLVTYSDMRKDSARNPGAPIFETFPDYLAEANGRQLMPPVDVTPLTQDEIDLVNDWVAQGGPECNDGVVPVTFDPIDQSTCDDTVNFEQHIQPQVLGIYCTGCHDGTSPLLPSFVTPTEYAAGAGDVGHPYYLPLTIFEASYHRMVDQSMPPYGGTPQAEIDLYLDWVELGFPEGPCL